jgi:oxygen-dependent protoporphyrinogen oxidase
MRIAIIGGGIAGLAAAYELEKARAAGEDVDYTLYEARPQLGGSIASEIVNGVVLERGPDSFLTEKPATAELCRELGLGGDLVPSNDADRKTHIVVHNRLIPLPDGLMFLVPTKLIPTAMTRLFSPMTKIRMGLELLIPPRPSGEADESVAAMVERHFGAEAVDRLADPLLSGIYGGDASQLSARTVLPKLVEMETEFGSLTRGMLAAHRKMRAMAKQRAAANGNATSGANGKARPAGAPRGIFTSLRGGMQQLVDAIAAGLNPGSVRLSTAVSAIEKISSGWRVTANGASATYHSIIVASPSWAAGVLLGPIDSELGETLSAIPCSSSITVNLVYDETQLGRLPDGFGFLVPASENRSMLACTFVHRKFLGRTPVGKVVLRAFLGGMKNEALLAESDANLLVTVRRELSEILGENVLSLDAVPEVCQVSRFRRAMAQYSVGHGARKQLIAERVSRLEGLRLAGNAYDGIGVSDCVRLGRQAAKELLAAQPVAAK